jgi:acetolactate decarboxylase
MIASVRLLALFLVLFAAHASVFAQTDPGVIYQVSPLVLLKQGQYDGRVSFQDLKRHGDFGIGTVQGIDGEMVALDGQFYQITVDGKVHLIPDSQTSPFAMVTFFQPTQSVSLERVGSLKELESILDREIPDKTKIVAVKVEASFATIRFRSVPPQVKPYPPLDAVIKAQRVFDRENISGVMVGFRFPDYLEGANAAGYHFHFITDDRTVGGHVLDCSLAQAKAHLSGLQRYFLDCLYQ